MNTNLSLFSAFSNNSHSASADALPEWLHLCPAGTFTAVDGRGPFRLADPDAVITASMQGGKIALDECHATDWQGGHPAPARGWISEMQARPDGIWGKVEWTGAGAALVRDCAYRGISPVLLARQDTQPGEPMDITRILRAALTNDPGLQQLKTLHQRQQPSRGTQDMDFIHKARQAMGLPDDTSEDGLLAALSAARLQNDAFGKALAAAGLTGADATCEQLIAFCKSHQNNGSEKELRQTIIALESRITAYESRHAFERATMVVDQAIRDGKPIRAMRDHYISRHQRDAAQVEAELSALPSINGGGVVTAPVDPGNPAGSLSEADQQVIAKMGLDPVVYRRQLQDRQEAL